MKKTRLSLLTIVLPLIISAQSSPLDKIFDKYSEKQGYTSVNLTKYMFDLFSSIDTANKKEDKDFKDITTTLSGIRILTKDSLTDPNEGEGFYRDVINSLPLKEYKDLMVIKEATENVRFLIKEKDGKISELIMVIGGKKEAILIVIDGNIDLKKISKLSQSMNIKGLNYLDKVNSKAQ